MKSIALAVGPMALLVAPEAVASGWTLNPGVLASGVFARESVFALGGEASFMIFPADRVIQEQVGFGGFFQAQSYAFDYGRYAGGVQFGSIFGGELGYAFREAGSDTAASHGIHAAAFASIGVAALSLRSTIPISDEPDPLRPAPGFELALCLALKIPIPFGDAQVMGNLPHGRPLRDGERSILPPLLAEGSPIESEALPDARAREWAEDGRLEYASVPAFLRLAAELDALGARRLAARARAAAREELGHARACFALASAHSGVRLMAGPMPAPAPRVPSLDTLARESVVDGIVGEGASATRARQRVEKERDPRTRRVLEVIAREEQSHADLARDVVRFTERSRNRAAHTLSRRSAPDAPSHSHSSSKSAALRLFIATRTRPRTRA